MSRQSETCTGGEPLEVHLARIGVGIVAGAVVALVKYAGSDSEVAARFTDENVNFAALLLKMVGYSILPVILGAVGGWISDERKVHKIFWIAISMPVIIAAAAGGSASPRPPEALPIGPAGWNFEELLPVTSAYASEASAAEIGPTVLPKAKPSPFVEGLQLFLGNTPRDQTRYRLVVHSVKDDKAKAEAIAAKLNRDFKLPAAASVGERKPGNDYWPIVLDGWTTYADAKRLKDGIQGMNFGFDTDDNPYISVEGR